MTVLNLTPHTVHVFKESQFEGLEQKGMSFLADSVEGVPVAEYPSVGVARISTSTEEVQSSLPGEVVSTVYGEATGIPELNGEECLIVSLPMQFMARQTGLGCAEQMVAPYKVVLLRSNPSQVLGCMGFTY